MNAKALLLGLTAMLVPAISGATEYWDLAPVDRGIVWHADEDLPHYDHLEMSGKRTACVIRYGVNADRSFYIEKSLVWPTLRTLPNDTHGSLMRKINFDLPKSILINERPVQEYVDSISFDGMLRVGSTIGDGVHLTRSYLPSTDENAFIEIYTISNTGNNRVRIEIPDTHTSFTTAADRGVKGEYVIEGNSLDTSCFYLYPDEITSFYYIITAHEKDSKPLSIEPLVEAAARKALLAEWKDALVLETPDDVLNRMFEFSKVRACESIYQTKSGPMHGPGGETYYAAIWANDQAEYANPFFPFTGYDYGNASADHSFDLFAGYMNDDFRPIPSSIIAEGDSYWNGAGDRGDAAMIAYGASRYALARGDEGTARRLWPLIEWCLKYCNRKMNSQGVVESDADELEHRFPAGEANLCTSSLYYDALISAAALSRDLGESKTVSRDYLKRAERLRRAMNVYFAGPVEGFDTYAYYDGNDLLRSWICIPLTVGIYDKAQATVNALFSDKLWSDNGLLTQSGDNTYWDRSTLYAFRGALQAGFIDEVMPKLSYYSRTRLLGDHVPYAIEAWPEGNQRHLSAESALYARIFTEGLFGIRPIGLRSFELKPQLPEDWDHMALRHIKAFGSDFDIEVSAMNSDKTHVKVISGEKTLVDKAVKRGSMIKVTI